VLHPGSRVRHRRCAGGSLWPGSGPSAWTSRCGGGCPLSRRPSSRRLPPSVPAHRTATAPTTFGVIWLNPSSRWPVERRSRGAAKCGGGARSNVAGWRSSGQPRHLRPHPQTSLPRPLRRRVPPHPKRRRPVRPAPAVCPRLGKRSWRTRRERSCSDMGRRSGVCFTTARVVRFTRPVYGCVRPYRMDATR